MFSRAAPLFVVMLPLLTFAGCKKHGSAAGLDASDDASSAAAPAPDAAPSVATAASASASAAPAAPEAPTAGAAAGGGPFQGHYKCMGGLDVSQKGSAVSASWKNSTGNLHYAGSCTAGGDTCSGTDTKTIKSGTKEEKVQEPLKMVLKGATLLVNGTTCTRQ